MRRRLIAVIAATLLVVRVEARIGETPEQLGQRYGAPIKQAFNPDGDGVCIYHSKQFKEIRVHFANGVSEREDYIYLGDPPSPDPALVEAIRAENPNQRIEDGWDRVRVYSELAFQREVDRLSWQPNGRECTYSGIVKARTDERSQWAILNDHGTVIEMAMQIRGYSRLFKLTPDHRYSVTALEQLAADLNTPLAVVGKREHVDWTDCVDDAGLNGLQQLVRITEGDTVVFDRSICSLHHVKMERRNVHVAYGMLAYSKAESYCIAHYPNFRDYAVGGCIVGDTKFTPIYLCPKCVAECNEYKRRHPEENKNPLD